MKIEIEAARSKKMRQHRLGPLLNGDRAAVSDLSNAWINDLTNHPWPSTASDKAM